jgi:hypothetical protein
MYREQGDVWMITPVVRDRDFLDMKDLCIEFATSIDFELDYQQLLRESASIKELYRMPSGAGFLLRANNQSIGIIGLRKINYNTAEIKKFYVRTTPAFVRWSNNLLDVAVDWALQSGYKKIRVEPGAFHPTLKKILPEAGFREKFIRNGESPELQRVLEKVLVSIPEYYQL